MNDQHAEYRDHAAALAPSLTFPWPADRPPSPDEWVAWFLSLDAPAQYEVAQTVIADHATARHHGGAVRPATSPDTPTS